MYLFDKLFGKKAAPTGTPAPTPVPQAQPTTPTFSAPGTHIGHDPALIPALKEDHRKLLTLFQGIIATSAGGDLANAQKLLAQFQTQLMDHLLKENVRLYVYLEHVLTNDPVSHEMMHGFRHEMDGIGRVVVAFLQKYRNIAAHPELAGALQQDLRGIGEALVGRIKREEDLLYPMYTSPGLG